MKNIDIDMKYAAFLLIEPDGRCWLATPHGDPIEVLLAFPDDKQPK